MNTLTIDQGVLKDPAHAAGVRPDGDGSVLWQLRANGVQAIGHELTHDGAPSRVGEDHVDERVAHVGSSTQGAHIGRSVALAFEGGDPARPLVMGVLREPGRWPLAEPPAQVEVDVDGERMQVSAKQELVLRCGKASIILTKAGKVLIQGSYVSSRSTGVNRIKGGSVQLN